MLTLIDGEGFTGIATDGTTVTNYGKIALDSAYDISIVKSGSNSGFVTEPQTVLYGSYYMRIDNEVVVNMTSTGMHDRVLTRDEMITAIDNLANYSAVAGEEDGDIVITKTNDALNFTITETSDIDNNAGQDVHRLVLGDNAASIKVYRGNVKLDSTSDIVFGGDTDAMAAAGLIPLGKIPPPSIW